MFRYIFVLSAVAFSLVMLPAAYAASISVHRTGDRIYSIDGNAMETVTGIELNISYDSASLKNPTVAQGSLISGALLATNTNKPGFIKIAIVSTRAFAASGQIVSITFASRTGVGSITSLAANLIDRDGQPVALAGTTIDQSGVYSPSGGAITDPGVPFGQTGSSFPTTTTTTTPTTASTPSTLAATGQAFLGTVSMPGDAPQKSDVKKVEADSQPSLPAEPPRPSVADSAAGAGKAVEPPKAKTSKVTLYKGVLENFQAYKGEKSPAQMTALFSKEIAANIRQSPLVALSDGTTTVSISVKPGTVSDTAPNFALKGAELKAVQWDDAHAAWNIDALPETGALESTLIILSGSDIIEYPITVAPAVADRAFTDEEFAAFLKGTVPAAAQRDLNADGKYDVLDDYIYTANYLARKNTVKPATPAK